MGINGLNSLFNLFKSSQRFEQKFLQVMDKLSKTSKRVHSPRITFDRHNIPELGKAFTEITHGLKNPRITAGLNCGKGQSIMGLRIQDGDEIVGHFAFSLRQNTGGSPSLQTKLQILNHEQKAISGSLMINPNGSTKGDIISAFSSRGGKYRIEQGRGDAIHFDAFLNPEQAESFAQLIGGKTSELAKNLRQIQAHPNKFLNQVLTGYTKEAENLASTTTKTTKGASKATKASRATKPIPQTKSVNERTFATEAEQIMKIEGTPTPEDVMKYRDIIAKKMGYSPELITIDVLDDVPGVANACFDPVTAKIIINKNLLQKCTHFDIFDCIIHEADHLNTGVKTAKALGLEKYKPKIMHHNPKGVFNKDFYVEAMKQVDIADFNVKPFLDEERELYKISKLPKGKYSTMKRRYMYATSPNEAHARNAEKQLVSELNQRGIKIKSIIRPDGFGVTPDEHLVQIMPQIEAKLAQYPLAQRNRKFNKAYYKALEEINPEYAKLDAKSYKGLSNGIIDKNGTVIKPNEWERYNDLWKEIFYTRKETVETKILKRALELI